MQTQAAPLREAPFEAIDGVDCRRILTVDGVHIPSMDRETASVTLADGRVIEQHRQSIVVTADGSMTGRLHRGFGRCDLCWMVAAKLVQAGQLDLGSAYTSSACHLSHLRHSALSGVAICPRHTRTLPTPDGPIFVSVLEAEELEAQRTLRLPLQWLAGCLLGTDDA